MPKWKVGNWLSKNPFTTMMDCKSAWIQNFFECVKSIIGFTETGSLETAVGFPLSTKRMHNVFIGFVIIFQSTNCKVRICDISFFVVYFIDFSFSSVEKINIWKVWRRFKVFGMHYFSLSLSLSLSQYIYIYIYRVSQNKCNPLIW